MVTPSSTEETWDCVVIGAGISGLLAARRIQRAAFRVVVVDKGRQVGGRMATRRRGEARFDHGAQFFTCRSPEFETVVREWLETGAAVQWCSGFGDAPDGHPRYRGHPGMTAGPKQLARELHTRTRFRVTAVTGEAAAWQITMENGSRLSARSLVVSPPVPQTLALLDAGGVALPSETRAKLEEIRYDPCIALLARLDGPSAIPDPGAVQAKESVLQWVGDNARKGISALPGLTLHASATFSRDHWNRNDAEVVSRMLDAASSWLGSSVTEAQVQRWLYAMPNPGIAARSLAIEQPLPLVFCGDAFGGPKVEGAALSGMEAGAWIADALGRRSR